MCIQIGNQNGRTILSDHAKIGGRRLSRRMAHLDPPATTFGPAWRTPRRRRLNLQTRTPPISPRGFAHSAGAPCEWRFGVKICIKNLVLTVTSFWVPFWVQFGGHFRVRGAKTPVWKRAFRMRHPSKMDVLPQNASEKRGSKNCTKKWLIFRQKMDPKRH